MEPFIGDARSDKKLSFKCERIGILPRDPLIALVDLIECIWWTGFDRLSTMFVHLKNGLGRKAGVMDLL